MSEISRENVNELPKKQSNKYTKKLTKLVLSSQDKQKLNVFHCNYARSLLKSFNHFFLLFGIVINPLNNISNYQMKTALDAFHAAKM